MKKIARIRELRERAGLSQDQLAVLANTSQPQIDRLEKGGRRVTIEWLLRLASALGCAPADLLPDATGGEPIEMEFVRRFRRISTANQQSVMKLVRDLPGGADPAEEARPDPPAPNSAAPSMVAREPQPRQVTPSRRPRGHGPVTIHDPGEPFK